jgi:hypothetical protein
LKIAFLIYGATQITGIYYGIGRRLTTISPAQAQTALLCWWLCELFYIPSTIFLKLSVGIFLHRLAMQRTHLYLIRFMMCASGLFGSAYLLLAIFQCRPISAWWVQKHDPPASLTKGRCFDNRTVVIVTFVSCSLNAVADCVFALLPLFMVKDLRMPRKQKRLVACILGFANIACVATIVRTPFTIKFYHDDDFLYETRTFALLSTIEPGVGIAAACTATLRPLLQRVLRRDASGWFSMAQPHPQGHRKAGTASYTPGVSPAPDVSSNYMEISATWRPPSPKQKTRKSFITGKEMKHLVSSPTASEFHESFVLKSAGEHDGRQRFLPVRVEREKSLGERGGAETGTVETERTVGFTFFDEGEEG